MKFFVEDRKEVFFYHLFWYSDDEEASDYFDCYSLRYISPEEFQETLKEYEAIVKAFEDGCHKANEDSGWNRIWATSRTNGKSSRDVVQSSEYSVICQRRDELMKDVTLPPVKLQFIINNLDLKYIESTPVSI